MAGSWDKAISAFGHSGYFANVEALGTFLAENAIEKVKNGGGVLTGILLAQLDHEISRLDFISFGHQWLHCEQPRIGSHLGGYGLAATRCWTFAGGRRGGF